MLASGRLALRSALSDLTAARRQVREYAAHVLTIWRKSLEVPLRLLVDPEARKPPFPAPLTVSDGKAAYCHRTHKH